MTDSTQALDILQAIFSSIPPHIRDEITSEPKNNRLRLCKEASISLGGNNRGTNKVDAFGVTMEWCGEAYAFERDHTGLVRKPKSRVFVAQVVRFPGGVGVTCDKLWGAILAHRTGVFQHEARMGALSERREAAKAVLPTFPKGSNSYEGQSGNLYISLGEARLSLTYDDSLGAYIPGTLQVNELGTDIGQAFDSLENLGASYPVVPTVPTVETEAPAPTPEPVVEPTVEPSTASEEAPKAPKAKAKAPSKQGKATRAAKAAKAPKASTIK